MKTRNSGVIRVGMRGSLPILSAAMREIRVTMHIEPTHTDMKS